jgi:glycosyltransferase involved in cell wall biosynthesis
VIHKGLDVLVEAIKEFPEIKLFVAGVSPSDKGIVDLNFPNIEDVGFLNVNTKEFVDIINKCDFVILPSCSEGMSTSVLTCMRHGLIPVITCQSGVLFNELSIEIKELSVEGISNAIKKCLAIDIETIISMKKKVESFSNENFTVEKFEKNMTKIIREFINNEK